MEEKEEGLRTTKFAAKALDVTPTTLLSYVRSSDFPEKPAVRWRGKQKHYVWTDAIIEGYRSILLKARR